MSTKTTNFDLVKPAQNEIFNVDVFNGNMDTIDAEMAKPPLTVNSVKPNPTTRNLYLEKVPLSDNLASDIAQLNSGVFVQRTSGGSSSIETGAAFLQSLKGNMVHTGYVAEVLDMTVTPMEDSNITATLNRETFIAYVTSSSTITLTYSTEWSANPETYGITVTGTPVAGDSITVEYVKEDRGTITVATPVNFKSTGWNLYNNTDGYARVVAYSAEYGYKVGGTYTLLEFAETLTSEHTTITVSETGLFNVPSDGFVFVSGGNNTTYIYPTWTTWVNGYVGNFQAYTVDTIDLAEVMLLFPYGLMAVGDVKDEISFTAQKAYNRIERLAYNSTNLENVIASGVAYECDTNYIYAVLESATETDIDLSGSYMANDHGIEFFEGTNVGVDVQILYGENLKDKLRTDVLTISAQELGWSQKNQVWQNLGFERFKFASDATSKTWSEFVSSVASFATDSMIFYTVSTAVGTQLLGSSQSINGFCLIQKGSSSNAYYMFSNRNGMSVGNIAISSGNVTIYWSSVDTKVTDTSATFSDVSVTSGTNTRFGSITLDPGHYIIVGTASWASNATGYRELSFCDSEGTQLNVAAKTIVAAVNGSNTRQQTTITFKPSSQTTIYMYGKQNSGSSLSCSPRYAIARIQ